MSPESITPVLVLSAERCHREYGFRARAKARPGMTNFTASVVPANACDRMNDNRLINWKNLRRDQIVRQQCDGIVGRQFLAEQAGLFPRRFGRKAPQQDQ
jgi:hypothetical protein